MRNDKLDFTVRDRILAILDAEAQARINAQNEFKDANMSYAYIAGYTGSVLSNIRAILNEV
jgi:hypothetical protein